MMMMMTYSKKLFYQIFLKEVIKIKKLLLRPNNKYVMMCLLLYGVVYNLQTNFGSDHFQSLNIAILDRKRSS